MVKRKTIEELFKGCHFEREIILLYVRWYLRYKFSSRDLVEIMAERGLTVSPTTILRWVQRIVPEFEKRWNWYAAAAGSAWRVDETYVKIRGQWVCMYRDVDREGKTIDFRLSPRGDVAAAKAFLSRALKSQGTVPSSITLDRYAASHRAVHDMENKGDLPAEVKL